MNDGITKGQATVPNHKVGLVNDRKEIARDAGQLMKDVSAATADSHGSARTTIEATLDAARARIIDARTVVAERARSAAGQTEAYVKDNPWSVLGAAAAIGFAIGLLLHRR